MAADMYKVLRMETLNLPERDKAAELLRETAEWVQPIMRKRSWTVPLLGECNFRSNGTLGMNINRGSKILIRLRRVGEGGAFYWLEHVVHTMLHELCHIVHSNHSAAFYQLLDELVAEWESNRAKNIRGTGAGFDAKGTKANPAAHNPATVRDAKRLAAEAADARRRRADLFVGGVAVGGQAIAAASEREAVRLATLRRCSDWCGAHRDDPNDQHDQHDQYDQHEHYDQIGIVGDGIDERNNAVDDDGVNRNRRNRNAIGDDVRDDDSYPQQKRSRAEDDAIRNCDETALPLASEWECVSCTMRNSVCDALCGACECVRDGWWRCERCTCANSSLFRCATCDTPRAMQ